MNLRVRNRITENRTLDRVLEWTALIVVMHLCVYHFLKVSTFWFGYTDLYKTVTMASVVGVGGLRLVWCLLREFGQAGTRQEKNGILRKGLLSVLLSVPCVIVAFKYDYKFWLCVPFVAFCLYGMEPERVLKLFVISMGTTLAVTVLSSLSGAIENFLYAESERKGLVRGAYGTAYPTDFSSCLVYLFLFIWAVQRRKTVSHTAFFLLASLGVAYLCYTYPRSYTGTISGLVIAIVVAYDGLFEKGAFGHKGTKWIQKLGDGLIVCAFPIFGMAVYVLTWLQGQGNGLAQQVNSWMSGRLRMNWLSYQKYGIHPFGALTPQSGSGGTLIHDEGYEFLDSSYALLLIRYGWVLTLIVAVLWILMTRKAIRMGRRRLALAFAVIAFHSISEHHFPELNYNMLLAMPLCGFASVREAVEERKWTPRYAGGWIAGGIAVGGFLWLLPKLLSWVRGLVLLEKWGGGGEGSLKIFGFWFLFVLLLCLLWFFLRQILSANALAKRYQNRHPDRMTDVNYHSQRRKLLEDIGWHKKPIGSAVGLMAVIALILGGSLLVNRRLETGAVQYSAQIEADSEALKAVLAGSNAPVFAGQAEEFYKRKISGIADRIFTPEELANTQKGTILLDHGNEGYHLIRTKAKYTEISPYSGLFTYDDAVVRTLEDRGYTFSRVYSAEREANLKSLAAGNGLTESKSGGIMLSGSEKSLTGGMDLSQFNGTYTVVFDLTSHEMEKAAGAEREVCSLRVAAQEGKRVFAERVITLDDFGADGTCLAEVEYTVPRRGVNGINFQVLCRDSVSLEVNRIAWHQMEPKK